MSSLSPTRANSKPILTPLELGKIKDQKEEDKKNYKTNQVKLVRYQNFMKSQQLNLKCKEHKKKRKEIKKEEDVEDELVNQFNNTMNISTKRRRVDDV